MQMYVKLRVKVLLLLALSTEVTLGKEWPKWLDVGSDVESLGDICQSDNDTIGRKLGCDCKYPVATPRLNLFADCSGQTLGTESSLLPLQLNVSRHVRQLIFSDNFFTELRENSFGSVDGVSEANFARNRIQSVSGIRFPRLGTLDLSHNLIANLTVPAFKNSPKIENLDLSFNQITFIEVETFSQLAYLRILNLASNNIGFGVELYDEYTFSLDDLDRLEDINLSNNSLREFPSKILEGSHHIKSLNLAKNKILYIPEGTFFFLENLETLDLSGNLFNVFHAHAFQGLVSLGTLILDGNNELILIEEHAFAGLVALRELSCQRNHRLTGIHQLAFKGYEKENNDSNPSVVRLSDNALTFLDADLLSWKNLEYLELVRNPWICDCNLQWVAELQKHSSADAALLIDPDFKCDSPAPLRGTPVASVDAEELMCYSRTASIAGIIGIVILCTLLLAFCVIIALHALGLLPEPIRKFFGHAHSLPKYIRVRSKRSNGTLIGKDNAEPTPELEWDNGDIGR